MGNGEITFVLLEKILQFRNLFLKKTSLIMRVNPR